MKRLLELIETLLMKIERKILLLLNSDFKMLIAREKTKGKKSIVLTKDNELLNK